jgi:tetratricopeptide (TPR) repeat protein
MKSTFSVPALLALALITLTTQLNAQSAPASAPSEMGKKMMAEFMKLPEEQRIEFNKNVRLAQKLYQEKRIFDALQAIDELEKTHKNHPACLSLRGGCYVEMRAFDKAYVIFEKLQELSPNSQNIMFNLAELDFVMKNWASSHKRFTKLLTILPQSNKSLRQLSEFKLLLCNLKMGRTDEAKSMQNKYGEWDDTPYYHYAPAAILFHEGKDEDAKKILRDALFIWRDRAQLSSWQDTLIEIGYVRSLYGQDQPEGNTGLPGAAGGDTSAEELTPETPQVAPVIPLDTE